MNYRERFKIDLTRKTKSWQTACACIIYYITLIKNAVIETYAVYLYGNI